MRWLSPTLVLVPWLVACAGTEAHPTTPAAIDPAPATTATPAPVPAKASTCPGSIEAKEGLTPITDEALLKQALGEPGKGSLCTGQVFVVAQPVKVYRVWTKAKAFTQLGRWWSFSQPKGPVDAYRAANAICPEWSTLDVVSACTLTVGAKVVVGPGQSATCEKTAYPASAENQVFVPNETKDPAARKVFVDNCTDGVTWP